MTDKPERPPLTPEAFDAMLEQSTLFQQMRQEIAAKGSAPAVVMSEARISRLEASMLGKPRRR